MIGKLFDRQAAPAQDGQVVVVRGGGIYLVEDDMGRRYEVRSHMVLQIGLRVVFKGDWVLALAGRPVEAKIYQV